MGAGSAGGVAPVAFLWGNGSTSTTQTIAHTPGVYSITLQGTDASSTVATTTCSATVIQGAPVISSFTATPASITAGASAVLSWTATNASSTSIDNGVGTIVGTSVTVSPTVTTTYHLTATNPATSSGANVTVTVNATNTIQAQITALLAQIAALKAQIVTLLQQQNGTGTTTATSTPPVNCFTKSNNGHGKKWQWIRNFFKSECDTRDTDHDGTPNNVDTDDDNDGILDVNDAHPLRFDLSTTSTSTVQSTHHGEDEGHGRKNDN